MKTNKKELLDSFKGGLVVSCQVQHDDTDVFITPTLEAAKAIWEAGAEIIALYCTCRRNGSRYRWPYLIWIYGSNQAYRATGFTGIRPYVP